jgi:hypothetical protein
VSGPVAALRAAGFDVGAHNHAEAILQGDFAAEAERLVEALLDFRITSREVIQSGGGHAELTMRLRNALVARGWHKHVFVVRTIVDGVEREAIGHEVDHVLRVPNRTLALAIEWNTKAPFFDRDLENFQRLQAQGAISPGILVTRGSSLQAALTDIVASALRTAGVAAVSDLEAWGVKERRRRQMKNLGALASRGVPFADAFARSFVADKYGMATTHWTKLAKRVARGVGSPCPLLLVGLPVQIVSDYSAATAEL